MTGRPEKELPRRLVVEEGESLAEKREEFLAEQSDWGGRCRHCETTIKGTRAQIAAHRCPQFEAYLESRQ